MWVHATVVRVRPEHGEVQPEAARCECGSAGSHPRALIRPPMFHLGHLRGGADDSVSEFEREMSSGA